MIDVDHERAFYEAFYAQYASMPDAELRCDRAAFERAFDDPRHPLYERRRLYAAVLEALLSEPVAGVRVLDYGCGTGDWGVLLATEGAQVTLLDLSPAGVAVGCRRAAIHGVTDRVRGVARDASDLSVFRDEEFDLVYANASLHHTLKYPRAVEELVRVVGPGARLVLAETFGNNPVLNLARRLRATIAAEAVEQGEGIILGDDHLAVLRAHFRDVHVRPLNLLAMAKRLARGRFHLSTVRAGVRALEAIDARLLALAPPLGRYCGEVIVMARK
ncbi:MAG: class I SAM-dependent methyltransferase [Vicinamibacterales bacterium]